MISPTPPPDGGRPPAGGLVVVASAAEAVGLAALWAAARPGAEARAGEVLHHALRAGDQASVARWAPGVAAEAEALGAFADAAAAWGHASAAARRVGAPPGELLTATVGAVRDHRLAGHLAASREEVADALIGISVWPSRPYGEFDPELPALLERALGWLAPDDHVHRRGLYGALAVERYYEPGRPERGAADGRAAIAGARQAGGVATLGLALHAFMLGASATPVTEEWLAAAEELVSLEGRDLPAELGWVGRLQRVVGRMGLDRPIDVRAEVALCVARAEQLRQPLSACSRCGCKGMVAALDDDHAAAMAVAAAAVPLHAALGFTDPGAQVLLLEVDHRLAHGGLAEIHDHLAAAAEVLEFPAVRLFAALAALDADDPAMARTHLEAAGWAPAHDFLWLAHLVLAAEVAAALRPPSVDAIAEALPPLADAVVVVRTATMCWGSLHHFLGILDAARDDHAGARKHLARAVEVNERLGVRRWARRSAEALDALG